ncbi:MAG: hypothetical protein JW869_00550 [Candidatus Omnitrophica bacterium]|nr:hypothetical protein [Candidatus Omnitrophota bacterium]
MKNIFYAILVILVVLGGIFVYQNFTKFLDENKVLKEVINRLEADSRIAEALVTNVRYDEAEDRNYTTIKFLEYNSNQEPLPAKYFTFPGNIIQFQTLVIRFEDIHVRMRDSLRGKSAYLFWKVFMLDGPNTKEFEITKVDKIPQGYKIDGPEHPFEKRLWQKFWSYALDAREAGNIGIKNAQIEAPGTMFIPGTLYTIKIEHDGGIRIDSQPLSAILRGERIPE